MRRFMVLSEGYMGINKGEILPENFDFSDGTNLMDWIKEFPEDFEEVFYEYTNPIHKDIDTIFSGNLRFGHTPKFEQLKHLHKDTDLGYFAVLILASMVSSSTWSKTFETMAENSIECAEELIKQLNEKQ